MKDREYPIKRKRIAIAISLLSLVTVTAIGVSIWALFFREPDVILSPDYAPQETEVNAEKVPNDGGDKMDTPEGGGAVSLT